jgi:DNA-binding NtrC family response regulator
MARILCISADVGTRTALTGLLFSLGHESHAEAAPDAALAWLGSHGTDLILLDPVPPRTFGAALVARLRATTADAAVVVLAGHGEHDAAMQARRAGAVAHLAKPVRADELELAVADALARTAAARELSSLRAAAESREAAHSFGVSAAARMLLDSIRTVALTEDPVLIVGEPGSGKAFAARAIHARGPRRASDFVSVECAALHGDTLAHALDEAGDGTLLLRGIDTASAAVRRRILRAQGTARILATSAREEFARPHTHGEDPLLARLAVLPIRVPPLRERREDIPLFADAIARTTASALGKPYAGLSAPSLALLARHDWPANLRELRDAVTEAVVAADAATLEPHHFAAARFGAAIAGAASGVRLPSLDVADAEQRLIAEALRRTGGNRTRAAELLGMSVRTLRHKLNTRERD